MDHFGHYEERVHFEHCSHCGEYFLGPSTLLPKEVLILVRVHSGFDAIF